MREIRLALLEADVNFKVVKDFVARVRERAMGQDVLKSLTPGQQVVKIVHEELTGADGQRRLAPRLRQAADRDPARRPPGLGQDDRRRQARAAAPQGGQKPALVAADLQRPAAIDQLEQLGKQIEVPVYREDSQDPVAVARNGVEQLARDGATSSSSTPPAASTSTRR